MRAMRQLTAIFMWTAVFCLLVALVMLLG